MRIFSLEGVDSFVVWIGLRTLAGGNLNSRKGESRRRLEQGLGHEEKHFLETVWYPAFMGLSGLYPEYEISASVTAPVFLDFAYLKAGLQLAIEIDGFRTHPAEMTRWQFSDSLMRQNHLILDGWKILRFSYDDIKEKPRICQQLLQQFMGKSLIGKKNESSAENFLQLEVLKYSSRLEHPIRPAGVIALLKSKKEMLKSCCRAWYKNKCCLRATIQKGFDATK